MASRWIALNTLLGSRIRGPGNVTAVPGELPNQVKTETGKLGIGRGNCVCWRFTILTVPSDGAALTTNLFLTVGQLSCAQLGEPLIIPAGILSGVVLLKETVGWKLLFHDTRVTIFGNIIPDPKPLGSLSAIPDTPSFCQDGYTGQLQSNLVVFPKCPHQEQTTHPAWASGEMPLNDLFTGPDWTAYRESVGFGTSTDLVFKVNSINCVGEIVHYAGRA